MYSRFTNNGRVFANHSPPLIKPGLASACRRCLGTQLTAAERFDAIGNVKGDARAMGDGRQHARRGLLVAMGCDVLMHLRGVRVRRGVNVRFRGVHMRRSRVNLRLRDVQTRRSAPHHDKGAECAHAPTSPTDQSSPAPTRRSTLFIVLLLSTLGTHRSRAPGRCRCHDFDGSMSLRSLFDVLSH